MAKQKAGFIRVGMVLYVWLVARYEWKREFLCVVSLRNALSLATAVVRLFWCILGGGMGCLTIWEEVDEEEENNYYSALDLCERKNNFRQATWMNSHTKTVRRL